MSTPTTPLLELRGIRKEYQTLVANDNINLTVNPGEIRAVLGENGAGKSTLMKVIYGVIQPSAGTIYWRGKEVSIPNPAAARKLGIGMVFQHFSLFETLTVVENVALGLDEKTSLKQLATKIKEVSQHYGLPVNPWAKVHTLSVGEMQRVEIIRCLLQKPQLLIMDEPTSVLSPPAVKVLFETLRQLATEGYSILYISHKLDEIKALCHSAVVLRAGKVSGSCDPREETPESMAKLMIGRALPTYTRAQTQPGEVRLKLQRVSRPASETFGIALEDITLEVRSGEIIGIAGVSGNGQRELLHLISGEERLANRQLGEIVICDQDAGRLNPRRRRQLGFGFVPEERLGRGAVPAMSLTHNSLLTMLRPQAVKAGFIRYPVARSYTQRCIDDFNVKCSGTEAEAHSLSGGNLQKFIVGREVLQTPKILVLSQPTWGVDVGAAAFIRQHLITLKSQGTAILLISEELEELFEVSDQIAVIAKGRLSPLKPTAQTNVEEIGVWMSGLWPGAAPPASQAAQTRDLP